MLTDTEKNIIYIAESKLADAGEWLEATFTENKIVAKNAGQLAMTTDDYTAKGLTASLNECLALCEIVLIPENGLSGEAIWRLVEIRKQALALKDGTIDGPYERQYVNSTDIRSATGHQG